MNKKDLAQTIAKEFELSNSKSVNPPFLALV
jgi:hypothetical protein